MFTSFWIKNFIAVETLIKINAHEMNSDYNVT